MTSIPLWEGGGGNVDGGGEVHVSGRGLGKLSIPFSHSAGNLKLP